MAVAGMIAIAHGTVATVVAERTETGAEAMRSLGAGYGQGRTFGRPGPLPRA